MNKNDLYSFHAEFEKIVLAQLNASVNFINFGVINEALKATTAPIV